jgi:hypothetical protein
VKRRIFVAFVTEQGRRSGLFHGDDYHRPLCADTTERRCRMAVSDDGGGIIIPRAFYEVVAYVPERK